MARESIKKYIFFTHILTFKRGRQGQNGDKKSRGKNSEEGYGRRGTWKTGKRRESRYIIWEWRENGKYSQKYAKKYDKKIQTYKIHNFLTYFLSSR